MSGYGQNSFDEKVDVYWSTTPTKSGPSVRVVVLTISDDSIIATRMQMGQLCDIIGNSVKGRSVSFPNVIRVKGHLEAIMCNEEPYTEKGKRIMNGLSLSLRELDFRQSKLTMVTDNCFNGMKGLQSLSFPSHLSTIGDNCVQNCVRLSNLVMPVSMSKIGDGFLKGAVSLKRFSYPDGIDTISKGSLNGCKSLIDLDIGNTISVIERDVAKDCTSLKTVKWNVRELEVVESGLMDQCTSLQSFELTGMVSHMSSKCFTGCNNLRKISVETSDPSMMVCHDMGDICNVSRIDVNVESRSRDSTAQITMNIAKTNVCTDSIINLEGEIVVTPNLKTILIDVPRSRCIDVSEWWELPRLNTLILKYSQ